MSVMGMKVLVVEDDAKLSAIVRKGLKEEGFAVDVRGNVKAGLELALSGGYDAILLDLRLPDASGLALVRELRRRENAVPVMIVSALGSVEDRVKGLNLGADDYLVKPFDFRELLARLRALKRRPPSVPRTVLKVADLSLDTIGQVATRGRHRIKLTSKEFALLEYLMHHVDTVVTRAMIVEHIWELDVQPSSNLVEVYINYLRDKIDRGFEPKLIHTVRGTGYVLRTPDAKDAPGH
jgi:DNA-binding response OmpR family regulator